MARRYRVFVSSASYMHEERNEAIAAIRACDCMPRVMEDWTAGIQSPLSKILEEISLSDFFVLLLGDKYGDKPRWTDDEKAALPGTEAHWSYVRAEYEHARACQKPIIALLSENGADCAENGSDRDSDKDSLQEQFRTLVRKSLLTKTWHSPKDIAAYVSSGLLDQIRPLESSLVIQTNAEMICEVARHISIKRQKKSPARQATLIQYSSRNVKDAVRKLVWSRIKTTLYIVSNESALPHQRRIVKDGIHALANHLDPIDPELAELNIEDYLTVYQYDTPGAIRLVTIDDEFLAIGSYVYMKKPRKGKEVVDIRGGELPMTIFPSTHAGLPMLKGMVRGLLANWHDKKLVTQLDPKEIYKLW